MACSSHRTPPLCQDLMGMCIARAVCMHDGYVTLSYLSSVCLDALGRPHSRVAPVGQAPLGYIPMRINASANSGPYHHSIGLFCAHLSIATSGFCCDLFERFPFTVPLILSLTLPVKKSLCHVPLFLALAARHKGRVVQLGVRTQLSIAVPGLYARFVCT